MWVPVISNICGDNLCWQQVMNLNCFMKSAIITSKCILLLQWILHLTWQLLCVSGTPRRSDDVTNTWYILYVPTSLLWNYDRQCQLYIVLTHFNLISSGGADRGWSPDQRCPACIAAHHGEIHGNMSSDFVL